MFKLAQIERAILHDYTGFCIACGNEQSGCEPDACNYACEACGQRQVFGAEEILIAHCELITDL